MLNFSFARFSFTVSGETPLVLPAYKGSTLRGGFGHAFRIHTPHPFILEPPEDTRTSYEPGETLSFGLILIGRAVDYLAYFIYTFEELGCLGIDRNRGKYKLLQVSENDASPHHIIPSPPSGGEGQGEGDVAQSPSAVSGLNPQLATRNSCFNQELRQPYNRTDSESEAISGFDPLAQ